MDVPLLTDAERIRLAQEDFGFFLGWVHETDARETFGGKAVPAKHHLEMIDLLTEETKHTLIVAPRQSAKTTVVAAWVEWELGRASLSGNKNWANDHRVLWFSNTAHQAYRPSNAIRATIEFNPIYKAIFPKVQPHKDKWSQEEWKVKGNNIKDSNFLALGVQGPALGARGLVIIYDDIADQDNMKTPRSRADLIEWLNNTADPILVPWGRFVMACTRWAWDDPAQWAEDQGWLTLPTHPMKALIEEGTESDARSTNIVQADAGSGLGDMGLERGTSDSAVTYRSYWPERFTVEWLLAKRKKTPLSFAKQWQNEVAPEEGMAFLREWFPRFDYLPSEVLFKANSWDTAASQGRGRSFSAGWSAHVTPDFHIYLYNLNRGQVLYPYLRQAVYMQAQQDHANYVIIEAKSSGKQLLDEFRLMYRQRKIQWKLEEWQPAGQKGSVTRFNYNEQVTDYCERGKVHLPSENFLRNRAGSALWLSEAELEIFSYPEGQTDDIVDAMCQLIYYVRQREQAALLYAATPREATPWAESWEGERARALV